MKPLRPPRGSAGWHGDAAEARRPLQAGLSRAGGGVTASPGVGRGPAERGRAGAPAPTPGGAAQAPGRGLGRAGSDKGGAAAIGPAWVRSCRLL